jgi:hypothetical protein
MHFSDAIHISSVPLLQNLCADPVMLNNFCFTVGLLNPIRGLQMNHFWLCTKITVVNQAFLALFIKSVLSSHHSAHYLNQQGC